MKIGDYENMLCPVCGNDYTHLMDVEEYKEGDGRKCVKLHFYCESGCEFIIDIHQHEGMTYVETTNI